MVASIQPGIEPARPPSVELGRRVAGWVGGRARNRRQRAGDAAAVRDYFMDAIVVLSVLVFLGLVTGLGMLVIGQNWPLH